MRRAAWNPMGRHRCVAHQAGTATHTARCSGITSNTAHNEKTWRLEQCQQRFSPPWSRACCSEQPRWHRRRWSIAIRLQLQLLRICPGISAGSHSRIRRRPRNLLRAGILQLRSSLCCPRLHRLEQRPVELLVSRVETLRTLTQQPRLGRGCCHVCLISSLHQMTARELVRTQQTRRRKCSGPLELPLTRHGRS